MDDKRGVGVPTGSDGARARVVSPVRSHHAAPKIDDRQPVSPIHNSTPLTPLRTVADARPPRRGSRNGPVITTTPDAQRPMTAKRIVCRPTTMTTTSATEHDLPTGRSRSGSGAHRLGRMRCHRDSPAVRRCNLRPARHAGGQADRQRVGQRGPGPEPDRLRRQGRTPSTGSTPRTPGCSMSRSPGLESDSSAPSSRYEHEQFVRSVMLAHYLLRKEAAMRTIGRAFLTLLPVLLLVLRLGWQLPRPPQPRQRPLLAPTMTVTSSEASPNQHEPCFDIQIHLQGWHDQYRNQIFHSRYESPNTCTGEKPLSSTASPPAVRSMSRRISPQGTIRAAIPLTDGRAFHRYHQRHRQ